MSEKQDQTMTDATAPKKDAKKDPKAPKEEELVNQSLFSLTKIAE
jgi:hypothetical protein